jgi:hypothetical protein
MFEQSLRFQMHTPRSLFWSSISDTFSLSQKTFLKLWSQRLYIYIFLPVIFSAADFMGAAKATIKATTKLALENPAKLDEEEDAEEDAIAADEPQPAVEQSIAVDAVGAESVATTVVESSSSEISSSAASAEIVAAVMAVDAVTAISDLAASAPAGSVAVAVADSTAIAKDVNATDDAVLSESATEHESAAAEIEQASEQASAVAAAVPSAKSAKANRKKKWSHALRAGGQLDEEILVAWGTVVSMRISEFFFEILETPRAEASFPRQPGWSVLMTLEYSSILSARFVLLLDFLSTLIPAAGLDMTWAVPTCASDIATWETL